MNIQSDRLLLERENSPSASDSEAPPSSQEYFTPEDIPSFPFQSDPGSDSDSETDAKENEDDLTDSDAPFEPDPGYEPVSQSPHAPPLGQLDNRVARLRKKRKIFHIFEDTTATNDCYSLMQDTLLIFKVSRAREFAARFVKNMCFAYILHVLAWLRPIALDVDQKLNTQWLDDLEEYLSLRDCSAVPEGVGTGKEDDWWVDYWLGELEDILMGIRKDWMAAFDGTKERLAPNTLQLDDSLSFMLGFAMCGGRNDMDIQRRRGRDFYLNLLEQLQQIARYHLPDSDILWCEYTQAELQYCYESEMMRRILQSGEMDDRIMRGGGGFLLE